MRDPVYAADVSAHVLRAGAYQQGSAPNWGTETPPAAPHWGDDGFTGAIQSRSRDHVGEDNVQADSSSSFDGPIARQSSWAPDTGRNDVWHALGRPDSIQSAAEVGHLVAYDGNSGTIVAVDVQVQRIGPYTVTLVSSYPIDASQELPASLDRIALHLIRLNVPVAPPPAPSESLTSTELPGSDGSVTAAPPQSPGRPTLPPATSSTAVAAPPAELQAAVHVTPLALTPGAATGGIGAVGIAAARGGIDVSGSGALSLSAPKAATVVGSYSAASLSHSFATLAAVMPQAAGLMKGAAAVADAVQIATGAVRVTASVTQEAQGMIAAIEPAAAALPARVAYNFIHFDAGAFRDVVANFATELASLPPGSGAGAANSSSVRAWAVTGTVLAVDALFLGYWYRKAERERRSRSTFAIAPCPAVAL